MFFRFTRTLLPFLALSASANAFDKRQDIDTDSLADAASSVLDGASIDTSALLSQAASLTAVLGTSIPTDPAQIASLASAAGFTDTASLLSLVESVAASGGASDIINSLTAAGSATVTDSASSESPSESEDEDAAQALAAFAFTSSFFVGLASTSVLAGFFLVL